MKVREIVRKIVREIVREIENLACDIFERGSRTVSLLRRSKIGDIVSKQYNIISRVFLFLLCERFYTAKREKFGNEYKKNMYGV